MKQLILLLTVVGMTSMNVMAARVLPAKGRVVDAQRQAVAFATVVLLKGTEQIAGTTTDGEGRFALKTTAGEYTLSVQCLGYEPIRKAVRMGDASELGELVMNPSSTAIESVEVRGQLIRREADRFVVNVAGSPAALGKDGIELLEHAPGVWVEQDKLSINGKSGSKVFIDDRELKMDPAQLTAYLRSLRAEEILKIEIIPTSGADYDADTASGVIKITLRRRRENGLDGSLAINTEQNGRTHLYGPSGNVNVHSGRLDFYASAWGFFGTDRMLSDERTDFTTADGGLASHSILSERFRNFGGSAGAVYELGRRHSIGAEIGYWRDRERTPTETRTDLTMDGSTTLSDSYYGSGIDRNNLSATFNYIFKLDTAGSTLKLLADYTRRETHSFNDNLTRFTSPTEVTDSVYRDDTPSLYHIATATLALEKHLSPSWTVQAGAKYTYNDMNNSALYEYRRQDAWIRNDSQSFTVDYTEQIGAVYGIVSAKLRRWDFVAGIRGEFTHTTGKRVGQNYVSLFPNANILYKLTPDGAHTVTAQYARKISRPNFWQLSPQRMQLSDYTYQTGNPELDPAYVQDVSLTLTLKHKYSITAGMSITSDEIQQLMRADADDPRKLSVVWENFDNTTNYYLTAVLPFQVTAWWQMNLHTVLLRQGQRVEQHGKANYQNVAFVNVSTTFTLPARFYVDLSYRFHTRNEFGNCWVESQHFLNAGIKKRFGDFLTVSFSGSSLLDDPQRVIALGDGFRRRVDMQQRWTSRMYRIGVTYTFKSGKAFHRKAVEAASEEEKARL